MDSSITSSNNSSLSFVPGQECPICCEDLTSHSLNPPALGVCVPCGHPMHVKCAKEWYKNVKQQEREKQKQEKQGRVVDAFPLTQKRCPLCNMKMQGFIQIYLDFSIFQSRKPPEPTLHNKNIPADGNIHWNDSESKNIQKLKNMIDLLQSQNEKLKQLHEKQPRQHATKTFGPAGAEPYSSCEYSILSNCLSTLEEDFKVGAIFLSSVLLALLVFTVISSIHPIDNTALKVYTVDESESLSVTMNLALSSASRSSESSPVVTLDAVINAFSLP